MLKGTRFALLGVAVVITTTVAAEAQIPEITGSPVIDRPTLLEWPKDNPPAVPDLTEPTSNRLWDFHASIDDCDMVLSTAGNYHMALRDLWFDHYLPSFSWSDHDGDDDNDGRDWRRGGLRNWYYTTSPPISAQQTVNGTLTIANLTANCLPQIAVGPGGLMNTLQSLQFADGTWVTKGDRIPIIRNQGNVILVKRGNPENIRSVWDLARVNLVTSSPTTEPGSFGNYSGSIYNIAAAQRGPEAAARLFNEIFNNNDVRHGDDDDRRGRGRGLWLAGERIHHREVPWSIAYGQADAGLMFYHLAKFAVDSFPHLFEIVPLGGTVDSPDPVAGNRVGTLFAIRINGDWNRRQYAAQEALIDDFLSPEFTVILNQYGLVRPPGF
ncbi:MAG: solute-binding protein [Inquilinus sp.]|nr:solute-binding protein [Inquilinus sp.]